MRWFWRAVGIGSVGAGALGTVVPLLPTTPFLLLAAWAFARSSPRWRAWLVEHPRFGPALHAWQTRRAIPRRARRLALLSLALGLVVSILLAVPAPILVLQGLAAVVVTLFLLSRPSD